MTDAKLKSIVDRIENLETERAAIGSDIRDVYAEAKSHKYPVKALRKVIAERKRRDASELEADMERIRAALGMPGATYRSVSEELGIPRSTLQRRVPRKQNGTEPAHDPQTGEITEQNAAPRSVSHPEASPQPAPEGGEGAGIHSDTPVLSGPASAAVGDADGPPPAPAAVNESCGGVESRHARYIEGLANDLRGSEPQVRVGAEPSRANKDAEPGSEVAAAQTPGSRLSSSPPDAPAAGVAPGPQDPDTDDLTPPPFLDRRKQVSA